ncbi:MAG: hypothetical protein LBG69_07800 [Zoogloeaceae bacterium]|jgi:hypothetical protein|nr:hypothetical protein [Zoogloeaceae bacterium]
MEKVTLLGLTPMPTQWQARHWQRRASTDGEHWLTMCSGYQLCGPIQIASPEKGVFNAQGIAKLAQIFHETFDYTYRHSRHNEF